MDKKFDKEVREIIGNEVKVEKTPVLEKPKHNVVANVSGVVDGKKQPLKDIGVFDGAGNFHISGAPKEVNDVLAMLMSCFARQGHIREGLIGDMIWGYQQVGYPPQRTVTGLSGLEKLGYVKFQAPDNTFVSIDSDKAGKAWIRYQPKLLQLLRQTVAVQFGGIKK